MAAVVYLQQGLILQHKPYRESSLLLDVFTEDFGIITILAKGVRKEKSKLAGLLLPFVLLKFSYFDKHELKILNQAELVISYPLQRLALYCGFYVNELLQKFLHKNDPHPQLFFHYQVCLLKLSLANAIEENLRYFELELLAESGYGIQLDVDCASAAIVQQQMRYTFVPGLGMIAASSGQISGQTLLSLTRRSSLNTVELTEAKLLLKTMLDNNLQGRPLKSREVLVKMFNYL